MPGNTWSTKCGDKAIIKAININDLDRLKVCAKVGFNLTAYDENNKNMAVLAREKSNHEVADWLIHYQHRLWKERGGELDKETLVQAIEFDNHLILAGFIERGFDVNQVVDNGMFPTVYAIFNDAHTVLNLLLEAGADVHAVFDFRPLIAMAAMFEQEEILKILIRSGADVNDADGSYVTPLMFAARDGNAEVVRILMDNGADAALKDKNGQTALDWAISSNHDHVLDLLR